MPTYTPFNTEVYASAQAGAMAGMAGAGVLTDPDSPDYNILSGMAVAYAQAFDTLWDETPEVPLSGTVHVINGSATITFSVVTSLLAGTVIVFASDPDVEFTILTTTVSSLTATLTAPYTGVTATATTSVIFGPGVPLDEYTCKVIMLATHQLWADRVPPPAPLFPNRGNNVQASYLNPVTYYPEVQGIIGMVQEGTAANAANGTTLPPCPGAGPTGPTGATGPAGPTGATGATGPAGGGGLGYAMFYGTAPGDYAATIAVGAPIDFPHAGPTSGAGIVRTGVGTFQLAAIGTYDVSFQVGITEAGQFQLSVGGALLANSVASRATGTTQIVLRSIVTTTLINQILSVVNPPGNATALTVTPSSGSLTAAPSANLVVVRLA